MAAARLDLELARRKAAHHEQRIAASERSANARLAALENQRRQAAGIAP